MEREDTFVTRQVVHVPIPTNETVASARAHQATIDMLTREGFKNAGLKTCFDWRNIEFKVLVFQKEL